MKKMTKGKQIPEKDIKILLKKEKKKGVIRIFLRNKRRNWLSIEEIII